ncbi:MAG: hypothetical protein ABIH67_05820 [Candidatus Uhrbacteria bacterium]
MEETMIILRIYSGPKAGQERAVKICHDGLGIILAEIILNQCRLDYAVWHADLSLAGDRERFWWKHLLEMRRLEERYWDEVQVILNTVQDLEESTISMSA